MLRLNKDDKVSTKSPCSFLLKTHLFRVEIVLKTLNWGN